MRTNLKVEIVVFPIRRALIPYPPQSKVEIGNITIGAHFAWILPCHCSVTEPVVNLVVNRV